VRLLLDTHAFLWFSSGDPRLTTSAKELIADLENDLLLSIASVWEMAIKSSLGKLDLPDTLEAFLSSAQEHVSFQILPIELSHATYVAALPFHHRDPFDRLLVAQATVEGIPLLSADSRFELYAVERRW